MSKGTVEALTRFGAAVACIVNINANTKDYNIVDLETYVMERFLAFPANGANRNIEVSKALVHRLKPLIDDITSQNRVGVLFRLSLMLLDSVLEKLNSPYKKRMVREAADAIIAVKDLQSTPRISALELSMAKLIFIAFNRVINDYMADKIKLTLLPTHVHDPLGPRVLIDPEKHTYIHIPAWANITRASLGHDKPELLIID